RSRETLHVTLREGVEIVRPHNDRNRAARRERGLHRDFRPGGNDQVHVGAHQFGRVGMKPTGLLARGTELTDEIAAGGETTVPQRVAERWIAHIHDIACRRRCGKRTAKKPDAINTPRLLRGEWMRPKGHCGRPTAEQRDERAPPHGAPKDFAKSNASLPHRAAAVCETDHGRKLPACAVQHSRTRKDRCGSIASAGRCPLHVRFSNRPIEVKRFQTTHRRGVDVSHGLVLLFGIGTKALPSWDSRTKWNNLCHGLTVIVTAGPSGHAISPHPSSREGHHSTARWSSIFLLSDLILGGCHAAAVACSRVHRNSVPSTHMRCMITASRRANATIAFFIPRRL